MRVTIDAILTVSLPGTEQGEKRWKLGLDGQMEGISINSRCKRLEMEKSRVRSRNRGPPHWALCPGIEWRQRGIQAQILWDLKCHGQVLMLHSGSNEKPLEGLDRRYDRFSHSGGPLCLLCGVGTVGAVGVGATSEVGLQLTHLRISNVQRSRPPLGLELIYSCSLAPTHYREAKGAGGSPWTHSII